jgi:hypothetical protein
MAESYREMCLIRVHPLDQEAALQTMSKLTGFIQESLAMHRWACNPEPFFTNTVWNLRK